LEISKTSFRWDIRAEKKNSAIEHASLKTIAAFLNSGGGTLLIGVEDDGKFKELKSMASIMKINFSCIYGI